ncbi:MAG: orotate phosphoribosyltransferase [Clostridiaceae bacterium]|nr:orotate phosphoribosyltransferase [Clostridiaceae bacterium]
MTDRIIDLLFETDAVRVSDPKSPFWYASGRLGPFYINTHFLLSNEIEALELLSIIESSSSSDRLTFPRLICEHLRKIYDRSLSFREVTDMIVKKAGDMDFDFISGGERRDFFFSILPAFILKKPHLCIFKDFQAVYSADFLSDGIHAYEANLIGKRALHIADLVTEASSYTRVWIPAIREAGATISDTIAVVDRKQGGGEILLKDGIRLQTLTQISPDFFESALAIGRITEPQYRMVLNFMQNPAEYMDVFLSENPSFIKEQIDLGGKAKERAEMAISKGYARPSDCNG